MVLQLVEHKAQQHAADLTDHRGRRRARHAHLREAQQAEDHDGVQNDVDHRAGQLRGHGQHGVAGSLHHALKGDGQEQAKAEHRHNAQIIGRHLLQFRVRRKYMEETVRPQQAEQQEHNESAQLQQHAAAGRFARLFGPLLPQLAADEAVDAHAQARGHGDHEQLDGKGQRYSRERVRAVARHEDAVHHVVEGLHQHAHHDGDGYLGHQLSHGHGAQHF